MKKKMLVIFLKYILGLGLLAWVIWSHWETAPGGETIGLGEALQKPIHWLPFFLAATFCLASVLLTFLRWFILVRAQELPFSLANALRLGLVGYYFNTFLPGSVGGDIIKAACIAREQSRRTVAVATVLLDRAVGLCALFWLAAIVGGFFWWSGALADVARQPFARGVLQTIVLGAAGIMIASLVFWILLGILPHGRAQKFAARLARIPRIGHSLAEFWRAVWMYRCRGRSIALALFLSLISHSGFVLTFFFAARTLSPADQVPSLGTHFLLVPVGAPVQAGFPAPGGVGGGEYGFGKLYEWLDASSASGVLGSLVQRSLTWVWGLVGYLVYLRMGSGLPRCAGENSLGLGKPHWQPPFPAETTAPRATDQAL